MEFLTYGVDYIIHLDKHLAELIHFFGGWTYLILGLIVFCETGFVVTPFLPGDSLLFVIGALSASGAMDVGLITLVLVVAGILGDTVNYHIGKYIGPKIFSRDNVKFLNKKHLLQAHDFYEKHGGKTIIIARFIPIIRTFAPFVAGIGKMSYRKFLLYNVVGALLWVFLFVFAGFYFGNLPVVEDNFAIIILAIIVISIMPGVISYMKSKRTTKYACVSEKTE